MNWVRVFGGASVLVGAFSMGAWSGYIWGYGLLQVLFNPILALIFIVLGALLVRLTYDTEDSHEQQPK